jgi:flagellar hook-associated protein 2
MAGLSVDGLVSGLDTTALIDSLIKAEGLQQTKLSTRLTAVKDAATAYRGVNTKLDALRTAAEALTKATTWGAATASATGGATATVTGAPQPGRTAFTVQSLAANHSVISTARFTGTADDDPIADLTYISGGVETTIAVGGSRTLADAVKAINDSGLGLTATTMDTNGDAAGGLALRVAATKAGAAQAFELSGFDRLTQGANAVLTFGDATPPLEMTSTSNSFTGLVPGVTFNVTETGPAAIDVAADPKAVASAVKAVVDAANAVLADIKGKTAATSATAKLKGDSALRRVTTELLGAVSGLVGSDSPGTFGVELTRDGTVKFDETKFLASLAADPDRARTALGGKPGSDGVPAVAGVVQRLVEVADDATNATTGVLTKLADGRDTLARDLQDRIDDWDDRLALRRQTLVRQFTGMETALSSLKQQSSWLAGQLASLPTY